MTKRRTTIADVARAANVSIMTVSRAINNKSGLSKELRQRILGIAEEMGYHPSMLARGLATRQTATVGLVVPSISNPFYAQIAEGIETVACEYGYSVFLLNTAEDVAREVSAMGSLLSHEIDGAILCSLRLPQRELINQLHRFPAVVLFQRELKKPLPNVVTIRVNDERAAQEAVQHFLEGGRWRIAYIGAPEDSFSSERRLEGYRAALNYAGVPFDPALVMHIMPGVARGKEAAEQLLSRYPDLDAILAFNDLVAIGALQACQAAGKNVPEEIAVIGADDIAMATLVRPQLSTSRVNLDLTGQLIMHTLLEMFAGQVSPAAYKIEPELILRESG